MRNICLFLILVLSHAAFATSSDVELTSAPANSSRQSVYVIPVKGMIEPALVYVMRRGLTEAEEKNAAAVILDMDTPGGAVQSAEEIVHLLQGVDIPTYTYVNPNAISAGAILAMATDYIYMSPGSKIGDAMPIMVSPFGGVQPLPEHEREKTVSYVAGLIRSAAQNNGHDDKLAEAMVRKEMEYKIGDKVISPEGQLLTLTNGEAEQMVDDPPRALLSSGTYDSLASMLASMDLNNAEIVRFEVTRSERIARWLAALSPLLLIAGLLGVYIEIKTPGFGIPGILGALSLVLFFWGHHIAGLAGSEELILFLFGVVLLGVEVFVIPGFGITGFSGLALMFWALLLMMVENAPGAPWYTPPTLDQLQGPLTTVTLSFLGTIFAAILIGRWLPSSSIARRLVLQSQSGKKDEVTQRKNIPAVGMAGRAVTNLHPSGRAAFGDLDVDVLTDGSFISRGSSVEIVSIQGSRIKVKAATVQNNG